jgi:hypothetical protein
MSARPSPTKVLFVAGTGRSGTTILSTILGQLPGAMAVGELRYVWERGFLEDHRCGCGQPFSQCPVWKAVVHQAYEGATAPDAVAVSRDLLSRLRMMRLPAMVLRQLRGRSAVPPHPHDDKIAALYTALSALQHPAVIVDSSKLPPYGKILERLPGIELYVVHIVRDPRANAFSWRRVKVTGDRDDDATMERLELWRSSAMWVVWNYLVEFWWPVRKGRAVRIRYEDFVDRPKEAVERIARLLDLDVSRTPFVDERSVSMRVTHTVAGNPNRHDRGLVTLRPDEEWRSAMPKLHRLVVSMFTLPGLRHFGYSLRG